MELAIPIIALGGLYMASKNSNKKEETEEGFQNIEPLPNTDIPNRNYPEEYPIQNAEVDQTSKLSTTYKYDTPSVYTDKYFNQPVVPESSGTDPFVSMTGASVGADYFQHNNMTPFFGAKNRSTILDSQSTEGIVDNYTGSGSQFITKTEQSPLFSPGEGYQYPHGTPNQNDFYQSRVNPSMRMANVKPFETQNVGPGLGLGASNQGSGGFNSGMALRDQWMPKTVDELRTDNNKRAGGIGMLGYEGPAASNVKTLGTIGKMEKNRVERTWETGPERYFTTTGVEKRQSLHAIPVERHVNRPETSTSYVGAAGTLLPETYNVGEYMDSKHMDLGEVPLGIATSTGKQIGTEHDYEIKAKKAYLNNRDTEETYFGAFSGAIGAVVAPLLDELRPSRKENAIGTLRPYQNAHTGISSSYLFNPADRPDVTIRETTEQNKYMPGVNSNQNGGAYRSTIHQPVSQQRDSTSRNYVGGSSAAEGTRGLRPYDAEYRQRNNDVKSSTIQGHMVQGNMNLMNSDINMRNRHGEIKNERPIVQNRGMTQPIGADQLFNTHTKQQYHSSIQLDRNTPEILDAFRKNPYTHPIGGT